MQFSCENCMDFYAVFFPYGILNTDLYCLSDVSGCSV